jgi:lipopolysaccharide transport system permease protein
MRSTSNTTKYDSTQIPVLIDASDRINPLDLQSLWDYRGLMLFMTWREITVRYKQTLLGLSWFVLQPVASLILFSVVFGLILDIPSGDIPYPVFVFSGLLPWRYFTSALSRGTTSLIANSALISKIYFPRQILLLVSVIVPVIDFLISFVILLILMAYYGYYPISLNILALPFFVLLSVLTAIAMNLWLASLNVIYRDVAQISGFLTQAWMYITPVIYPAFEVPERYQMLYSINPMVGVVEGFRWALLDTPNPNFTAMGLSVVVVMVIMGGGLIFFSHLERIFGEVI